MSCIVHHMATMPFNPSKYSDEVQKVSKDTPLEEIIYLLKRDGGVFVKGLISEADVDQAHQEAKPRLDADVEWNGSFFPGESALRCPVSDRRSSFISTNSTRTVSDRAQPDLYQNSSHESAVSSSLRPFSNLPTMVLVGRREEDVFV